MNEGFSLEPRAALDQKLRKEDFPLSAVKFRGRIFTGESHGDAANEIQKMFPNLTYDEEEQRVDGFASSDGKRFIDYHQAEELGIKDSQRR